jgi:hypothetical protein
MSDEERSDEAAEEPIEDLEAPAATQEDVAGGGKCGSPSTWCQDPTCLDTKVKCTRQSQDNRVYNR